LLGPTFRGQGVIRLEDVQADPRFETSCSYEGTPRGLSVRSYLAVPVVSRSGQVLGALFFGHARPGVFTERAERIAAGLAAQAAVALDNARLYEQAQRARVEAETGSRTKDEFLAVLSHELRAPLNAIVLWTEVLRAGQLDRETSARALETIERNTRLQAQLVDDLLDVSRVVSGKLRLNSHTVDLEPIITAAVASASAAIAAKSLRLEVTAAPGLFVLGDPGRLQQIVANLLSNAVKFTPKGGRIDVRLARMNAQAQIRVSDSGKGIPAAFLPHVFEYFRQADSTTTREHGGLGLGLAIVRRLVELHGGVVRAESEGEGRGATFTVELPVLTLLPTERRTPTRAPAEEGHTHAGRVLAGLQVLLVEDDLDSRDALRVLLERRCGATVTAVSSVADALEALGRRRPDVLISDIGMPGEDGFALIRKLRALESETDEGIPAVALTGYATMRDRERVLVAGYQAHLAKPVDPEELARTLEEVLRGRSPDAGDGSAPTRDGQERAST
jgi:signal transduction histidine kinase/ActR/RegA family two-component response regulator